MVSAASLPSPPRRLIAYGLSSRSNTMQLPLAPSRTTVPYSRTEIPAT